MNKIRDHPASGAFVPDPQAVAPARSPYPLARRFPPIPSGDEECARLFREYHRTRDPRIRERLILLHERLVRALAARYAHRGEPMEDLIQVGMIGLIQAIDRFDPARGVRFVTYAASTIVGVIKHFFRDKTWVAKVPRSLLELNDRARKASEALTVLLGRPPTIPEVAAHLGVSDEETLRAMEVSSARDVLSLDRVIDIESDGESSRRTRGDTLAAEDPRLDTALLRIDLENAAGHLDERKRKILLFRFFRGLSQTEVARRLGISQMHVSRLERQALACLRERMSDPK